MKMMEYMPLAKELASEMAFNLGYFAASTESSGDQKEINKRFAVDVGSGKLDNCIKATDQEFIYQAWLSGYKGKGEKKAKQKK